MRNVFNAENSIEAYMIHNLLEQHGINARVENKHLQGGMREYSASDFVRVLVADVDHEHASSVIKEWSSQQPSDNKHHNSKDSKGFIGFLLGAIIGGMMVFGWLNFPITEDGIDYNNDGVLETRYIYYRDKLKRTEVDRNLDNIIDMIYGYDFYGVLSYLKTDDDFDGDYETKYKFHRGILASRESDFSGDDKIDYQVKYRNGVIAEVEIFDSQRNQLRKLKKYTRGRLFAVEFDSNGDGILDIKEEYDFFEEVKATNRK